MKKNFYLPLIALTIGVAAYAQTTPSGVGINTNAPKATLDVKGKTPITFPEGIIAPIFDRGTLNDAEKFYTPAQKAAIVYVDNVSTGESTGQAENIDAKGYYYFDGDKWMKMSGGGSGSGDSPEPWQVIGDTTKADSNTQNIYQTAKVGIGAGYNDSKYKDAAEIDKMSQFEVNGAATNKESFSATLTDPNTIDFTKSNLARTSASAGSFTIKGLKDGGTYTLALEGTAQGTSLFTPSEPSIAIHYVNNGNTTSGKLTLYTFIVIGSNAYVWMTTGF
ncbi:MAG: hypothetical protein LBE36_11960 [Flavobacteriaceae bacterium]|jgi:hypothetical protein|nr:hypothetical protein [Flavobacteriaceae bacterium]